MRRRKSSDEETSSAPDAGNALDSVGLKMDLRLANARGIVRREVDKISRTS